MKVAINFVRTDKFWLTQKMAIIEETITSGGEMGA
jgi:hypothetical protein